MSVVVLVPLGETGMWRVQSANLGAANGALEFVEVDKANAESRASQARAWVAGKYDQGVEQLLRATLGPPRSLDDLVALSKGI